MTSPDQNSRDPRRDEVIAGEYVLGVLSAEDRRKVEARLRNDRVFAAMVSRWEENLSTINHELETMPPSPRVYSVIEQRIFEPSTRQARPQRSLWASLPFWRGAALAMTALSVVLVALGPEIFRSAPPAPEQIAELEGTGSPMGLVAHFDAAKGMLMMTPVAAKQESAKSLELWLVEDGKAPVSLGVLPQSGEGMIRVPDSMRPRLKGAVLAVSVEPLGGSPTGVATGPVIASGRARSF